MFRRCAEDRGLVFHCAVMNDYCIVSVLIFSKIALLHVLSVEESFQSAAGPAETGTGKWKFGTHCAAQA
jgi:hypothetical protein